MEEIQRCPCCERHCPVTQLHCRRGMLHFGKITEEEIRRMDEMDESAMPLDDLAIRCLRRSGHYLHHSAGLDGKMDNEQLMSALTEEEKRQLVALLKKCLNAWNKKSK